jgi:hypothetical protein
MAGGEHVANRMRTRRRVGAITVLVGLTASFAVTAFVPAHAEETTEGAPQGAPRITGELPARVTTADSAGNHPTPIIVDDRHKRGFTMGPNLHGPPIPKHNSSPLYLVMYDLEHLEIADEIPLETFREIDADGNEVWTQNTPSGIETWAIDEQRQQIYLVDRPADAVTGVACADTSLLVIDYGGDELSMSQKPLPCPAVPAGASQSMVVAAMTVFEPPSGGAKKLYIAGLFRYPDGLREAGDALANVPGLVENAGASLLVMQIDISGSQPTFDWYVDLREAGCGRREIAYVDRAGDDVISYCNDTRAGSFRFTGQNGYVVRIPLLNDWPVNSEGKPAERTDPVNGLVLDADMARTPALPGLVTPVLDPRSRKLLLATADSPANGNAVWLFDPRRAASRFVGVVSAGYGDQPPGNAGFGFDRTRGRGYLLTVKGLLVAPIRHQPLPAGLVYRVGLENPAPDKKPTEPDFVPYLSKEGPGSPNAPGRPAPIAVVSTLAHPRLIVPVTAGSCPGTQLGTRVVTNCPRYVVVDDYTTEPEDPKPRDPDALTQNIEEEDGKTNVSATGSGAVAAARMLITGGISRAVNQKDPNCTVVSVGVVAVPEEQQERQMYDGACLADQLISNGNRDVSFSAASVDAGSTTGATADAGGALFASGDNADDADMRRLASCGQDNVNAVQPRSGDDSSNAQSSSTTTTTSTTSTTAPPDPWRDRCNEVYDGLSDTGASDPRAGTHGTDDAGYPIRAVHCGDFGDAKTTTDQVQGTDDAPRNALSSSYVECDASTNAAKATSTGDGLALLTGGGTISIARLFSSIETVRTADGQVTTALASARGVVIGPLTIGEVRAEALTKAHGRPGTTSTTYTREWCAIAGDGIDIPGCIDPDLPENRSKIDALNDKLGTLRIELTPVKREMTPLGYQAVALKDPEAAQADVAVNDDDSFSVPSMQIVFYNDGNEGRNRYIVQLANIRSESRYGITESPDFAGDENAPPEEEPVEEVIDEAQSDLQEPEEIVTSETPVAEMLEAEYVELSDVEPVSDSRSVIALPAPGRPLVERILRAPAEIVKNAIQLLVTKPGQFALLFALWSFLASPVYLALRRRSFGQALMR